MPLQSTAMCEILIFVLCTSYFSLAAIVTANEGFEQTAHLEQVLLEDITASARIPSGLAQCRVVVVGNDDDLRRGMSRFDPSCRRNPIQPVHFDVHQHEVRAVCNGSRQRIHAINALVNLVGWVRHYTPD